jgi:hypothetical protein
MAVSRDRVFPTIMNTMMNTKETRSVREEVCAPLAGDMACGDPKYLGWMYQGVAGA